MTYLPDVNVWIALTSNSHVHHVSTKHWLDGVANEEIAFCRVSELGFMLTNRHVMQADVLTPSEAWRAYDSFRADSRILFLPESVRFSQRWRHAEAEISSSPNAWTDAYLAVFARHVNATVVTIDRGLKAVAGCSIKLIPCGTS